MQPEDDSSVESREQSRAGDPRPRTLDAPLPQPESAPAPHEPRLTPPNLAILSGEMSGDVVGGALAAELKTRRPELQLWGIGSRRMDAAGVELLYDSAEWSAIGVVEALRVWPRLRWRAYPHAVREIAARKPAAVVLIDFGAFNSKVARFCKANGFRVVWYFPPGSWRRKGRANAELASITDRIATPFPWSERRLRELGANAEFVGHPLCEIVRPTMTRAEFAQRFGMEPGRPIIGLLPGSRGFEVAHNTPAMLGAAQLIRAALADCQFVFGAASPAARRRIEDVLAERRTALASLAAWVQDGGQRIDARLRDLDRRIGLGSRQRLVTPEGIVITADVLRDPKPDRKRLLDQVRGQLELPPVVIAENLTYDVMAHSDVVIVCSGTATLEAALVGTPMVVLYRGSKLMEMEAKVRRVRPEHVGMPSIIADRRIMPEFLQDEATPEALADAALDLLRDPVVRSRAKADLAAVRAALAAPTPAGATARAADIVLETAGLSA